MKNIENLQPDTIDQIEGQEICSIVFVMNYVQIIFQSGAILSCLTDPEVTLPDGRKYGFPETGSRDALCTLIGSRITVSKFDDDKWYCFRTNTGAEIRIPLDDASRRGAEAMNFHTKDRTFEW